MQRWIAIVAIGVIALTGDATRAAPLDMADEGTTFDAQLGRALALVEEADFPGAFGQARLAYRLGQTDQARHQAARLAAGSAYRAGYFTRAEWWLRRAANHSASPEQTDEIAANFRTVRADNPLTMRFNLSAAPTSNINGGAERQVFFLDDYAFVLPNESLALSGIEMSGDVDVAYRVSRGARHQTSVGVYAFGRTYRLDRASRRRAPSASGSDYALTLLEASVTHRHLLFDTLGPSTAAVRAGRIWFGGRPTWDYARLSLAQDVTLGRDLSASVEAAIEGQRALDGVQSDARVYDLNVRLAQRLFNNDVVRLSLESRFNRAEIATYAFEDHRISVGYALGRAVMGMQLSAGISAGRKTYETFSLSPNGRRDDYVQANLNVVFQDVSVYGFSPSMTLTATRTRSNVDRFTTRSLQARFGIQSSF